MSDREKESKRRWGEMGQREEGEKERRGEARLRKKRSERKEGRGKKGAAKMLQGIWQGEARREQRQPDRQ
jgi:hypothetical protein